MENFELPNVSGLRTRLAGSIKPTSFTIMRCITWTKQRFGTNALEIFHCLCFDTNRLLHARLRGMLARPKANSSSHADSEVLTLSGNITCICWWQSLPIQIGTTLISMGGEITPIVVEDVYSTTVDYSLT